MSSDTTENKNTDSSTKPPNGSNGRATRRKPTASQTKSGGLVKAKKQDIIVLEDHTRVVETDSLPNHRPIELNDFEVVDTLNSAGNRPVMADTFAIVTTDSLPGHRPVAANSIDFSHVDLLPGNRPVASNDIDNPAELMGYLD
ncbi:MAG: hypothetical protein AAF921_08795 [Cyanobacteria bacterium P01_D01_bin.44]